MDLYELLSRCESSLSVSVILFDVPIWHQNVGCMLAHFDDGSTLSHLHVTDINFKDNVIIVKVNFFLDGDHHVE